MAFNMEEFFANARPFTMADFEDLGRPKFTQGELPAYPPTLKWTGSKTLRVSGIHFDILQEKIQKFFSGFEELKIVEWKPALSLWNIEYGTRPLENRTDMDRNMVILKRNCAWQAAVKALKTNMYRVPINHEDDLDYERKSWHNSELRIYGDPENGDIIIEFLKMQGDSVSFWYIFQAFNKYFSKDNVMFWMREQFLALANGVEFDGENFVMRYLLNELIVCDICTYLDTTVKIRPAF
jgi:hypothetical protein